jgi:hypothetical protein
MNLEKFNTKTLSHEDTKIKDVKKSVTYVGELDHSAFFEPLSLRVESYKFHANLTSEKLAQRVNFKNLSLKL